jgi:sugar phosphate isomerase/epimerase
MTEPEQWILGTSISAGSDLEMERIKEAGLDGIELTWHRMDLFDPEIKKLCGSKVEKAYKAGLQLWSVHIPYGVAWDPSSLDPDVRKPVVEKAGKVLRFAKEWGARRAVFHPSYEPIAPEERSARLNACKESLRQLAEISAEAGVTLAVECLPRTCLGNCADEIEFLVGDLPEIGICCDVNHLFKESPEQFIERLGSRIVTTHISDNDGIDEKHWYPGDGVIQWKSVLGALVQAGYAGAFMYEVRNPDPRVLAENWNTLHSLYREGE